MRRLARSGCALGCLGALLVATASAYMLSRAWYMEGLREAPEREVLARPLDPHAPGTDRVDLDAVFARARGEVAAVAPGAYYAGVVVRSRCGELTSLRGR